MSSISDCPGHVRIKPGRLVPHGNYIIATIAWLDERQRDRERERGGEGATLRGSLSLRRLRRGGGFRAKLATKSQRVSGRSPGDLAKRKRVLLGRSRREGCPAALAALVGGLAGAREGGLPNCVYELIE